MAPLLTVNKVSKRFANHLALDNVSISVPAGSIYGLLGPNGAGKTTLIRIINQITGPDSGTILLNGISMGQPDIHRLGYLPEERGLYKKMKVGEQAMYLAQLKGLSRAEAARRLRTWFEKFGILGWWNRRVEELSKGMQQKVQFIVTVVHGPDLLIFDEPFSGFDPINVNLIKDEILGLRDRGATIIFSTHNMASVEELCDHIALIDRSQKILEGEVRSIRAGYRTHTYDLSYGPRGKDLRTILGGAFEIIGESEEEQAMTARVRVSGDGQKDEMLQRMIAAADLKGFHEVIPSMNDIFIKKVKENEKSKKGQDG